MTHDQLHDPYILPPPEHRTIDQSLRDLLAEIHLEPTDRRMLEGFTDYAQQAGFVLGEVETDHVPDFAHTVSEFGSMVINKRFDVFDDSLSVARVVENPTVVDINRSKDAERAREERHSKGRSVRLRDGSVQSSFPPIQLLRHIDSFYEQYGTERSVRDSVIRDKLEQALREAQSTIFPDGHVLDPSKQKYEPQPTKLSPRATTYPQIAMYVRLRNVFRSLDLQTEADAADVVIAACGQRLLGLGKGAGALAAYGANGSSRLIQYPGERELPTDELPDKILPRRKKTIEAED